MTAALLFVLSLTVNADCPVLDGIYLCDGGGDDMSGLKVTQGTDDDGPWIVFGEGAPRVRLNGRGHFEAENGTKIGYQAVCRDATRIVLEIASSPVSPATSLEIHRTGTGYRVDADEEGAVSTETCIRHRGHGLKPPPAATADT
ncbi:MAG: hypothetical protein AAGE01_09495 [Pseudomonadota bacterium]